MNQAAIVYVTAPDLASAESIGRAVVEEGLAACANILPGMRSIYSWQGAVETADEVVLLLKTRAEHVDAVFAAVRSRHPYAVPALFALSPSAIDSAFAAWIADATGTNPPRPAHAP